MATSINIKIYDASATQADQPLLDVIVNDNSYRQRTIMGDHSLTLYYSLPEHVELPVGAWCTFEGQEYTLLVPSAFKMKHSREFEYTVTLEAQASKAKMYMFRNPIDGRLSFSLTAKPKEHLQMFCDNMNRRDAGWKVGDFLDTPEKVVTFDRCTCLSALQAMASEFETEFEIIGKTVSLHKMEYNKDNPLPLSYGKGNGFKSGVSRSNSETTPATEILYTKGGTQNIDPSKYGNTELLLPLGQIIGYDGEHFEDEAGYDSSKAQVYVSEQDGRAIYRDGQEFLTYAESSLDCTEYYPKRVGKVTAVEVQNLEKHFYDIIDDTIPENLNYEDCLIDGETMSIIFQSGQLAGREFDVKYKHEDRRFEIAPATIDGAEMPSATFPPQVGDTYAVFHCALPDAYICDNESKSGASWEMFRAAVKKLHEKSQQPYSFKGTLDGLWAKKDWTNIGGKIKLGGFISFTDERFQAETALLRIISIKDYINDPHSPSIELSNATISGGFSSVIQTLESQEVVVEKKHQDAIAFTKRRYRDTQETITAIQGAVQGFTDGITPVSVNTMQMIAGSPSLQFRFVRDRENQVPDSRYKVTYDQTTKVLKAPAGIIQHLTLGIDSISSSHAASEYRYWDMDAFESAPLTDGKARYLYALVSQRGESGRFSLSEEAVEMEADGYNYALLVGFLGTENDGVRSYTSLYGFTEILPGQISTDKVVSTDGNSYFDMLANAFKLGDSLDYNSKGDGKLRIKGSIVQNSAGDESVIGVFRGTYSGAYTYYDGDEVTYSVDGAISTYRCTSKTAIKGVVPTTTSKWTVIAQGTKGQDGASGAIPVFRGNWDTTAEYTGSSERRDIVYWQGEYWIANPEVGEFSGVDPSDLTGEWESFGASFESIATSLLLADWANLAGFVYNRGKMWSQTGEVNGKSSTEPSARGFIPNIELDGINGIIKTGDNVYLKKEGLEITNGIAKTLVRNQNIQEMVDELTPIGDDGLVTIPGYNIQGYDLGLESGKDYTLIVNTAFAVAVKDVMIYGRTSEWAQVILTIGVDLNIYYEGNTSLSPDETYSVGNDDVAIYTEDDDPTGTSKDLEGAGVIQNTVQFSLPQGARAEFEVHASHSCNGTYERYTVTPKTSGRYFENGSAEWYISRNRQWTLVGNDGICVNKNGTTIKIVNSNDTLQISMHGLPGNAPAEKGSLWVAKDGTLKIS